MIEEFRGQYRFLSNFTPAKVTFEGVEYRTTEHAYQAAKTIDTGEREFIRSLETPGQAKRAGREVTMRDNWESIKVSVMRELQIQKYAGDPGLREKLKSTAGMKIQEGNYWHDTEWGVCNCAKHAGSGKNMLGEILMRVRDALLE